MVDPFRQYDIRGVVGEAITPELAFKVGAALGSVLRSGTRIALGRDCRPSSPELAQRLIDGLCRSGCDVLDIGMVPTPVLYFAAMRYCDGYGVMITGSHNPSNHNGFKPMLGGINPPVEVLQVLRRRCNDLAGSAYTSRHAGRCMSMDVENDYLRCALAALQPLSAPLNVVVDAGNGAAGPIACKLYERLGAQVTALYCEPDGRFPNHHPDPVVPENLRDLCARVVSEGADVGLAYDADGDRLGVVSARGHVLPCDRVMVVLMSALLRELPGAACVYDIKCSDVLKLEVEKLGGQAFLSRTGHTLVKACMRQTGAMLAGEFSGHICYSDRWWGFDDALYAGARLLEGVDTGINIEQVIDALPRRVSTPELTVEVDEESKFVLVEQLQMNPQWFGSPVDFTYLDGVRVGWDYGWGLIRPSNTTPKLTLRMEAYTLEDLRSIYNQISHALQKVGIEPPELEILPETRLD